MRNMVLIAGLLCLGCNHNNAASEEPPNGWDISEPVPDTGWAGRFVWHPASEAVATRDAWSKFSNWWEEYTNDQHTTKFNYVVEFKFGADALGVSSSAYPYKRWVGVGGPFVDSDGRVHMYECGERDLLYLRGPMLIDCRFSGMFIIAGTLEAAVPLGTVPQFPPRLGSFIQETREGKGPTLPYYSATDSNAWEIEVSLRIGLPNRFVSLRGYSGNFLRWWVASPSSSAGPEVENE